MSIASDLFYLKHIAKHYDVLQMDRLTDGMHVYVRRDNNDQYLVVQVDYSSSFSVALIKTAVRSRLAFLIQKHCVFVRIENIGQIETIIKNQIV